MISPPFALLFELMSTVLREPNGQPRVPREPGILKRFAGLVEDRTAVASNHAREQAICAQTGIHSRLLIVQSVIVADRSICYKADRNGLVKWHRPRLIATLAVFVRLELASFDVVGVLLDIGVPLLGKVVQREDRRKWTDWYAGAAVDALDRVNEELSTCSNPGRPSS
jgi:hypothetical protein